MPIELNLAFVPPQHGLALEERFIDLQERNVPLVGVQVEAVDFARQLEVFLLAEARELHDERDEEFGQLDSELVCDAFCWHF